MAIDYDRAIQQTREIENTYTARETMLYALGIGFGNDPMDRAELPFVYENGLTAVPTMATVLFWDDSLALSTGLNFVMAVHGEQRITLHRPLPVGASVVARSRIADIFDKGEGRGALILLETEISDQATGEKLCTNRSTVFARGDGGFGGPAGSGPAPHPIPERAPDKVVDLKTRPDQALLYRLSGDRNPLHADPDVGAAAGFPQPILHGLCTYGFACRAILKGLLDYDASRITGFDVRFSAPVFPGETVRTEMWQDDGMISYRASVVERDVVVLNNGRCELGG